MSQHATITGEPLTLDLRIETPENVELTYQLAGPTLRCAAYCVDALIRGLIIGIVALFFACSGVGEALPGLTRGILLVLAFFLEWGYYVFSELLFNGTTIGKRAFGLRVIQERGYTITFWASLTRNLLRVVDMLPFFYGAGFFSMLVSRQFQRLGDRAARTVVIQERRVILPREPVIIEKIPQLNRQELSHFVPSQRTLSLIDQFLGRRHVLEYERGHDLAADLAIALAHRLNYRGDMERVEQFAMSFLAEVYVTFVKKEVADTIPPPKPPRPQKRTLRQRQPQEHRETSWDHETDE